MARNKGYPFYRPSLQGRRNRVKKRLRFNARGGARAVEDDIVRNEEPGKEIELPSRVQDILFSGNIPKGMTAREVDRITAQIARDGISDIATRDSIIDKVLGGRGRENKG